jgi:tetratricopeptide (TPR) repeat protein
LVDAVEWNTLPLDDQVTALRQLAFLENLAKRPHGAEEYLRRARDLPVRPEEKADIVIELVRLQRDAYSIDRAINELLSAMALLEPDDVVGEARLQETLGGLRLDAGDKDAARAAFGAALEAFRRLDDRAGQVRALIGAVQTDVGYHSENVAFWEAQRLLSRLRGPEADLLRRQLDEVDPR